MNKLETTTETPEREDDCSPAACSLFRVEIEYVVFVEAPDKETAERVAAYECRNEDPDICDANEVTKQEQIPAAWGKSLPYRDSSEVNADRTCDQIFKANATDIPPKSK